MDQFYIGIDVPMRDFLPAPGPAASLALVTRTGGQCREFHAWPRYAGHVSCHNLRSWEFSKVYATGTSGRAKARLLPALMVLITTFVLLCGLPSTGARAAIDGAAAVRLQVVARPGSASGADQDFELRDGSILRTGDGVQLRLTSDADAYVYVIAYGSSHTAMLLHPFSGRPEDALIRQGRREIIPGADVFLPLDGQEGRETLFKVVSDTPLADISDLLPRIEAHGDDLTAITAMIESTYPGVQRLSFKHIGASPLVGVAATTPRAVASPGTQDVTGEARTDAAASRGSSGASLLPPVDGGWSVPSTQGFGTDAAVPSAATVATPDPGATTDPGASTNAGATAAPDASVATAPATATSATSRPSTPAAPAATATAASPEAAPASSALRKAREAAGIDESQFRGILATLPDAGADAVPESVRKPYREQGVLSGGGSRIRALKDVQLEPDRRWPAGADDTNRFQN